MWTMHRFWQGVLNDNIANQPLYAEDNPDYDPSATLPEQYVSFITIAQKILSNTLSTDQGISLLAETYVQEVANSISNTDPTKQFVQLDDLIPQFELNKTLRN